MKKPQAKIFLVEDLQRAKLERDEKLDNLLSDIEGIKQGLDATVEGSSFEMGREFLVRQLEQHLMLLREMVLPENG